MSSTDPAELWLWLPMLACPPRLTSRTGSRTWNTGGCWWFESRRTAKSISGVVCSPSDTEKQNVHINVEVSVLGLCFLVLSFDLWFDLCAGGLWLLPDEPRPLLCYLLSVITVKNWFFRFGCGCLCIDRPGFLLAGPVLNSRCFKLQK